MDRCLEIKELLKYHNDQIINLNAELNEINKKYRNNKINFDRNTSYTITNKILICETCSDTSPCEHELIIEDPTLQINYLTMNGKDISSNLYHILSERGKEHFSKYL